MKIFNDENVPESEYSKYRIRRSVRVVIFDASKNIAVLKSISRGFHTLPGGGTENDESFEQAAVREAKEETGCDIKLTKHLGTIVQIWKDELLYHQVEGYIAVVVGKKGLPVFSDEDSADEKNTEVIWVNAGEASRLIILQLPHKRLYIEYVVKTDLEFLKSLLTQ